MGNGPSKEKQKEMGEWLKRNRIQYEFAEVYSDLSGDKDFDIRFIDYNNNCLIASRSFPKPTRVTPELVRQLVRKFEEEDLFPMLFEECEFEGADRTRGVPAVRMIRED